MHVECDQLIDVFPCSNRDKNSKQHHPSQHVLSSYYCSVECRYWFFIIRNPPKQWNCILTCLLYIIFEVDGKITGKEFVHGWINQTHMDKKMSIMFFMNLDMPSMDNVFGDDDMKAWFNGVDYNSELSLAYMIVV